MLPGETTGIVVRWAPQDKPVSTVTIGDKLVFGFDATAEQKISVDKSGTEAGGVGYVFHCHIIDHEDNEMMRPYIPVPTVPVPGPIEPVVPVVALSGGGGGGVCFIATAA
jgi:spore coat protein A, manganese oxidase